MTTSWMKIHTIASYWSIIVMLVDARPNEAYTVIE